MADEVSGSVIPYTSVFIDASLKDLITAVLECLLTHHNRDAMVQELQKMWTIPSNPNPVLPLLSVRTGFDLFLRVMNFAPGSEVIMSAMNIPDMVRIVQHHKLHIVPLDISIDTIAPKTELLPQLVSPRTVAIVICHLYGKYCPMEEIVAFAKQRNLYVIEDCAECFCGFDKLSHPESDLALYSFGVIKFYTSFGGAIAKVKPELYPRMLELHNTYSRQSQSVYMTKVLKYIAVYLALNVTVVNKTGIQLLQYFNYTNYKDAAVKMLRGFPNQLIEKIRAQPSGALLATMLRRQRSFSPADFYLQRLKGEYLASRLPPSLEVVGSKAEVNNYWLFPIIADNPDNLMYLLNALGVEAYRGATQLNIVEPCNGHPEPLVDPEPQREDLSPRREPGEQACDDETFGIDEGQGARGEEALSCDWRRKGVSVNRQYPHEAKYLVDHVLYLPVNKLVPFHVLNRMLRAIRIAVSINNTPGDEKVKVVLPSKL